MTMKRSYEMKISGFREFSKADPPLSVSPPYAERHGARRREVSDQDS